MAEPSRRASRLWIAGAMLAAFAVGTAGFVIGRSTEKPPPPPPAVTPPAPTPAPPPPPAIPAVPPPLGRAELIAAAGSAADAVAAGRPLPESVAALAGRDFELRLPFGCPGAPQLGAGSLEAEYDREAEALRVRAQPARWSPEEWLANPENLKEVPPAFEGIEGFWISRPWTVSEACPSQPRPAPATPELAPAAEEETLGIAQVFTSDGSRVGRRNGKAYQAVESVTPEARNMSAGLHLRLRGKLDGRPAGGPVLCRAPGGGRPVCLLSATFDEVAIENPATGATLATWDVSSSTIRPGDR